MLGVIGTSDKTSLTVGTGNKEAWPVLFSLANIDAGVRMKATSNAFALAAYLPIPKFQGVSAIVQSTLLARVYHICISIITQSFTLAERDGHTMPGPDGNIRICHPVLASWIADLPEQRLIACVSAGQSPTSTATQAEFGDYEQRPCRTREHTLSRIDAVLTRVNPASIPTYAREAGLLGLNGVFKPFWRSWGSADPSRFLTPDVLHAWHKFFFDHVLTWVINIMGGAELDRRMSCLQKCVGVRHWPNGVSKLKQCTGREHRDLEKILVPLIAGAVPDLVLRPIRALVEFIFQGQALLIYPEHRHSIGLALQEFHHYKNHIIHAGGRMGKQGPIPHFNIPKLEGMGRVVANAIENGSPYQWSSDMTERCHITMAKMPFRLGSMRGDFAAQSARIMDRTEKTRQFDVFTLLTYNRATLVNFMVDEATTVANHYPEATWLSHALPPGEYRVRGAAAKVSLFDKVTPRLSDDLEVAFSVTLRPHYARQPIVNAAQQFRLPDLHGSLGDFFVLHESHAMRGGRRKSSGTSFLPFTTVNIWQNFRLQQHSNQDATILLPSRTVQALAPTLDMPFGRCNTVLIRDSGPNSGSLADSSGNCTWFILCAPEFTDAFNS